MIKWLIDWYQKIFSPDTGLLKVLYPNGCCKYYPSCSQYMKESIEKKGLVIGLTKGMWRILRCNPWSKGGVDKP